MSPSNWSILGIAAVCAMIFSDHRQNHSRQTISAPGDVFSVPLAPSREALSDLAAAGRRPGNHFQAANGSPVTVIERRMGAVLVETAEGRRGWVFSEWIRPK